MPTIQQLGRFELTSPKLVITDPGYEEETARSVGLGCFVAPCAMGEWLVDLTLDTTPQRPWDMPRTVIAVHTDYPALLKSSDWQRVGDGVGGDSGLIGVHDLAHFHDVSVIPPEQQWTFNDGPADPNDFWYSFLCEAIRNRDAAVIPYGFVISWDGGMDVDTISSDGRVAALRLSISGWPNRI